ncbi:MAG: WG repeat-containing protein, partial [Angelakisella sp.]
MMNYKVKLVAMAAALLLTVTACGTPSRASSAPAAPSSGSAAPEASSQAAPPEASSQVTPPSATDTDKPVTGFSLAIPMQYDWVTPFSDGLAQVGTNVGENLGDANYPYYRQNRCYIDATGKVVLELDPSYSSAGSFCEGKAVVYRKFQDNREYNYIDKTGKVLLEHWLADERGFGGGGDNGAFTRNLWLTAEEPAVFPKYLSGAIRMGSSKNEAVLYDSNLETVIPYGICNWIEWLTDTEYVIVSTVQPTADPNAFGNALYGVLKLDGSVVLEQKYSSVSYLPDYGFIASTVKPGADPNALDGKLYGAFKLDGSVALEQKYSAMTYLPNYGFAVKDTPDAPCRLLLHDGSSVVPQGYTASDIALKDAETLFFTVTGADGSSEFGTMDKTGKVLTELVPNKNHSLYFAQLAASVSKPLPTVVPAGMEMLSQDDKTQIVATGKPYTEDYKLVPDVKVGIADLAGNWLVKPTYEATSLLCEGIFKICNGHTFDADRGVEMATDFSLVSADEKVKSEAYKDFGNLSE